ncbi:hypothetical protein NL676_002633 [Syzygium grande]|nr:hypothetical protein NL676_002633 [Syzygium grande]
MKKKKKMINDGVDVGDTGRSSSGSRRAENHKSVSRRRPNLRNIPPAPVRATQIPWRVPRNVPHVCGVGANIVIS